MEAVEYGRPEIRLIPDNPTEVAKALDDEIVALGVAMMKAVRSWSRIGQIVVTMDRDAHWKRLGYKSHGSWLMSVEARTGYCRATLYHFAQKFTDIEKHPHIADMVQMTEGTMEVYRQLPEALQRDPEIKERAKRAPRAKELRDHIAEAHPEAHVETRWKLELNLDASVEPMWRQFLELARASNGDPAMTYEQAFELELLGPRLDIMRSEMKKP
jgi:hypothetical protein